MGDFILPNLRDKPLSVLHVGRGFGIVDKLPHFLSVPGRGPDMDDCVVARVKEAFPLAKGPISVHRLDVETSGLMVLALRRDVHRTLSMQFEKREVNKSYIALLEGRVEADGGRIEALLSGKSLNGRRRPRACGSNPSPDARTSCACTPRTKKASAIPSSVTAYMAIPIWPNGSCYTAHSYLLTIRRRASACILICRRRFSCRIQP